MLLHPYAQQQQQQRPTVTQHLFEHNHPLTRPYAQTKRYERYGRCFGHSSTVWHLDWSADSMTLQSVDSSYEILYWSVRPPAPIKQARPCPADIGDMMRSGAVCNASHCALGSLPSLARLEPLLLLGGMPETPVTVSLTSPRPCFSAWLAGAREPAQHRVGDSDRHARLWCDGHLAGRHGRDGRERSGQIERRGAGGTRHR